MEAHNASKADSDDEYLDDVVVRAALERLQRAFDYKAVESVHCERFAEFESKSTDYIKINLLENVTELSYAFAEVVQTTVDTGVVRIEEINTEREYILVSPTEK